MPDEAAAKLFVPFFSTKDTGTGLGLAMVAKIVALHGGTVSVGRSTTLQGARFALEFPAAAPKTRPNAVSGERPGPDPA